MASHDWFGRWHGGAKIPSTVIEGLSTLAGGSTGMSTGVGLALSTKASVGHVHAQSEITGLESSLAALAAQISTKAAGSHTHPQSAITNLESTIAALDAKISTKAAGAHTHAQADVTNLESTLAAIASSMVGLAAQISTKAAGTHTHVQSAITDLESTLAAISAAVSTKAAGVHVHLAANSTAAGFAPQLPANSTTFLRSDLTWASPPAGAAVPWSSVTFDFGYANLRTLRVSISDAAVASTTTRIVWAQRCLPETHDNGGDAELFTVTVAPDAGSFVAYVRGVDGPIGGIVKAMYQVN